MTKGFVCGGVYLGGLVRNIQNIERQIMNRQFLKAIGSLTAVAAVIATGLVVSTQRGHADDGGDSDQSKVRIGFAIAPVPLNLTGKNRDLVGLGSYLVNASADCNGCHTKSPDTQYVFGGIPYFGQHPTKVNPATYMGGGSDFGPFGAVEIVSRNLTPDKTGLPEGGNTFDDFLKIMRKGTDLDKWHPTCSSTSGPHCIPPPFDGSLLQVMPWPTFQNMTDNDLRAIYEYLRAIPCLEGDPGNPAGADTKGHRCH